jgi:hypothetical protein
MRRVIMALVVMGSLVAAGAGLAAALDQTGTLRLSDGSVAAGIGFSWGKGTLSYADKTYPVKVEGLSGNYVAVGVDGTRLTLAN